MSKKPPRVTDEQILVRYFKVEREYERPGVHERLHQLIAILENAARDLYVKAGRTAEFPLYLIEPQPPDDAVGRLRRELECHKLEGDFFIRRALMAITKRLRTSATPTTSAEYRKLAHAIDRVADRARRGFMVHLDVRKTLGSSNGRPRSVAMEILLRMADGKNIGTAALARLLSDGGIVPPDYSQDDPDSDTMAARWEVILKAARARRRRRTK